MTRKLTLAAALVALVFTAAAALPQGQKRQAKINGFLVDAMCASSHGTDVEAKEHATSCALMPSCEKSGYAVVSKNTVYKFDEQGNKLAAALLRDTKTQKGLAVSVEGTLNGDTLSVDTMTEVR